MLVCHPMIYIFAYIILYSQCRRLILSLIKFTKIYCEWDSECIYILCKCLRDNLWWFNNENLIFYAWNSDDLDTCGVAHLRFNKSNIRRKWLFDLFKLVHKIKNLFSPFSSSTCFSYEFIYCRTYRNGSMWERAIEHQWNALKCFIHNPCFQVELILKVK